MTLDELIGELIDARAKTTKDSPVRLKVPALIGFTHHAVTQIEVTEYDEGVDIVLVQGSSTVATQD